MLKKIVGRKKKTETKRLKTMTVYCGSWYGNDPKYKKLAEDLGNEMAKHGVSLVYGGGLFGMMGVLAKTIHDQGGKVIPITMKHIVEFERSEKFTNENTGEPLKLKGVKNIIARDLHSRKRMLHSKADAICILPGSIGTLDELYEVLVLRHLNVFQKPIVILNQDGYWDLVQKQIEHVVAAGFVGPDVFDCYRMIETAEGVIPAIEDMLGQQSRVFKENPPPKKLKE